MAQVLVGTSIEPLLRHGDQWGLAAQTELGSDCRRLADEFARLSKEGHKILMHGGHDATLRAAAFFHLRFEGIHPLRDGNGRVGRLLMAAQCEEFYRVPIEDVLSQLDAHTDDYRSIHATRTPEFQFELMVDLLSRLLAVAVEGELKLPFPLGPRFPETRYRFTKPKR